jgi:hypothetical protein
MKNYRNALAALVLAFVFSTSAFADDGIMHTDKTSATPTPTPSTTQSLAADGIMYPQVAEPTPQTADITTEIALSLLQSVLSLV